MSTPNVGLPTLPQNSLQVSPVLNADLQIIDCMLQLVPQDKDLSAPPTTVAGDVGKTWLVGASPTGAWAGHVNHIALCTAAGLWLFVVPKPAWKAYVQDEGKDYRFNGTAWVLVV